VRAIGIDLGGTKIEGAVLDEALRPVHRVRVATERARGYEHILDRVAEVVAALRPHAPEARVIGIGTPGSLSARDGSLKNSNTTCLNGRPVHADLERRLGLPVRLENDANCFALAEARGGAAEGHARASGGITRSIPPARPATAAGAAASRRCSRGRRWRRRTAVRAGRPFPRRKSPGAPRRARRPRGRSSSATSTASGARSPT